LAGAVGRGDDWLDFGAVASYRKGIYRSEFVVRRVSWVAARYCETAATNDSASSVYRAVVKGSVEKQKTAKSRPSTECRE